MLNSYSYTYKKPHLIKNEHFWWTNFSEPNSFFKKNIFDKKIKLVTKENKRKLFIKNNCCEAVYNKITLI